MRYYLIHSVQTQYFVFTKNRVSYVKNELVTVLQIIFYSRHFHEKIYYWKSV